ncbi:hypothetical protein K493DRAFT_341409 [Basidiobolus meristosporus CBS 931.73]|uniref:Guanylyl cyclase n=1 Tax=Basidiobolus meristosporus CBS 931.73 TaxID=1314790 RepID=A0A1Y1XQX6_9FUNG|nr:hypothetical protein K493DRAFT_341409 [Basidiobolus meristosporus CBS 931.73]|eukprot:ORX88055.1 hypothetical protein K493DRAFT_341409 [Basidiobolus meristosporus CBS 931.73]
MPQTAHDVQPEHGDSIVPHIIQLADWDCGLACVYMILVGLGLKNTSMTDIRQACAVESVWTIDLAYLIRKFYDVDFTYYTSYMGINPTHTTQEFYQESMEGDEERISRQFSAAKKNNIRVIRMILPLVDFKRFLLGQKYAILTLVDLRFLKCEKCRRKRNVFSGLCGPFGCFQSSASKGEYIGHFIVLIQYDFSRNLFIYRDPGSHDDHCTIRPDQLEKARSSMGTDHDCIVVKLP